jgi:iron complex outermembrane receptor protein
VRFPTLTADSVRKLSAFPGDGRMQAAELQNNFSIGMLGKTGVGAIDDAHITWGGQFRRDRVSSYRDWLSDRQTGQAIVLDQKGGYAQIESPLSDKLRLVLSGRYDDHDKYDPQFSPKAALLFSPVQDQTIRVTYNRAFKSPTVLQTDFYFPNFQPFVGVFGNTDGFIIKNNAGTVVNTLSPIRPEINNTWELGYKGVVAGKLYVDVAGYHSVFTDFMSPLVVIANPLLPVGATTAYDAKTGVKVTDPAGGPQVALTYFNVGEATITGVDAGLRYYFTDNIAASGNVSLIKVDTIKASPTAPEATAFNSASARFTAGMDFTEIARHTNGAFTIRYVNGYDFRSGVNWGLIPGFGTLDLSANYKIPSSGARITLQVQNLFACVSGTSTPPAIGINSGATPPAAPVGKATYSSGQKCGFGQSHSEMINMPQIGTMAFLGVRWDGR